MSDASDRRSRPARDESSDELPPEQPSSDDLLHRVDPDAPGRSLLDDSGDAVEPNEPA